MKRPGYIMIRETAVRYGVSRAKLHRLVQLGRLEAAKDPRDERVTLLRTEDLDQFFHFPREEGEEMTYPAPRSNEAGAGRLTPKLRARMDALRNRVSGGKRFTTDGAEIIREEREKRTRRVSSNLCSRPSKPASRPGCTARPSHWQTTCI